MEHGRLCVPVYLFPLLLVSLCTGRFPALHQEPLEPLKRLLILKAGCQAAFLPQDPHFFGGRMKSSLKLLVFPIVLMLAMLACNIGAPAPNSTPDPFATLNALYTAAVQTEQASGSPIATNTNAAPGTSVPATATLGLPTLTYKTNTPQPPVARCNAAAF